MITTSPFPMIERCSCYGLRILGKEQTFWISNQYDVAKLLQSTNKLYSYSTCHLGDVWLLFHERFSAVDIARALVSTSSLLTYTFLSRIRLHAYIRQLEDIEYIKTTYKLMSENLFKSLHIQRNMFDTYEPTLETMREDLRTGFWIT